MSSNSMASRLLRCIILSNSLLSAFVSTLSTNFWSASRSSLTHSWLPWALSKIATLADKSYRILLTTCNYSLFYLCIAMIALASSLSTSSLMFWRVVSCWDISERLFRLRLLRSDREILLLIPVRKSLLFTFCFSSLRIYSRACSFRPTMDFRF